MRKKMKFTYTYRSSDGQRHSAEIEAESRDAAFAKIRTELGIKPIKVVAEEDGSSKSAASPNSSARTQLSGAGGSRSRATVWGAAILAAILLVVLGGVAWWMRRPNRESQTANGEPPAASQGQPITVATPQGPVTLSVAPPLPRQAIPGDRRKIEEAVAQERDTPVFRFATERWLARFAEPGRVVAAPADTRPTEAEFAACLREPIRIASTDFTEVVDLKRIVTGMKREMRAYIAGGGTLEGYLAELEKRQRLEISYRDNAERRLNDMLNGQEARSRSGQPSLKAAYAYWLKANAQLQAMGIYPLALPDALRSYQMSLDIEE